MSTPRSSTPTSPPSFAHPTACRGLRASWGSSNMQLLREHGDDDVSVGPSSHRDLRPRRIRPEPVRRAHRSPPGSPIASPPSPTAPPTRSRSRKSRVGDQTHFTRFRDGVAWTDAALITRPTMPGPSSRTSCGHSEVYRDVDHQAGARRAQKTKAGAGPPERRATLSSTRSFLPPRRLPSGRVAGRTTWEGASVTAN